MKKILNYLYDFILKYYTILTMKDPCEKCLVKACCSTACEYKTVLDNFIYPHSSIKMKKFVTWCWVITVIYVVVLYGVAITYRVNNIPFITH